MELSAEDHRLFNAVEFNDISAAETVQLALQNGANVNAVRDGRTPLFAACLRRNGSEQIIRILLVAGADARWRNRNGVSVVFIACHIGNLSAVQLLINHDIRLLEMTNDEKETPLIIAVRGHNYDILRFLLDHGADPRPAHTALMTACQHGDSETLRLLLDAGVDVETRDEDQQTALHYAARRGHIEVVRELVLQHNANMFAVNNNGRTFFDSACRLSRDDVANTLLEVYGNKLAQDLGRLALHELLRAAEYSFVEDHGFHPPLNPLRIILPLGKLTLKHFCTLLHTLDPELIRNRDDTGKLPIHIACQANAPVEVLALILELDPSTLCIADFTGALPIHLLCGSTAGTEYASVRYVIQSFPGSVAVQTNAGDYPFMVAASDSSSASLSVVYELVRADPVLFNYWTHSC